MATRKLPHVETQCLASHAKSKLPGRKFMISFANAPAAEAFLAREIGCGDLSEKKYACGLREPLSGLLSTRQNVILLPIAIL